MRPGIEKRGYVIGEDVYLLHVPERIIPGNMVYELEHNLRTIETDISEIGEKVKGFTKTFVKRK
ncbi:hypothetical protein ACFSKI_10525 [Pseudogracilibacillus auburnensis]|uniref:hypothetical protein n=1 Tax=Pseudogracilibacillus auburnensis TaxID=1494959 RepID=UPI00314508FE